MRRLTLLLVLALVLFVDPGHADSRPNIIFIMARA